MAHHDYDCPIPSSKGHDWTWTATPNQVMMGLVSPAEHGRSLACWISWTNFRSILSCFQWFSCIYSTNRLVLHCSRCCWSPATRLKLLTPRQPKVSEMRRVLVTFLPQLSTDVHHVHRSFFLHARYGDRCRYSHENSSPSAERKPCKEFLKGNCKNFGCILKFSFKTIQQKSGAVV